MRPVRNVTLIKPPPNHVYRLEAKDGAAHFVTSPIVQSQMTGYKVDFYIHQKAHSNALELACKDYEISRKQLNAIIGRRDATIKRLKLTIDLTWAAFIIAAVAVGASWL